MDDSNVDRISPWASNNYAGASGEDEPSSSVQSSGTEQDNDTPDFSEMSPATFVQVAYRTDRRSYQPCRYPADSYTVQPGQVGSSHLYQVAESSFDQDQEPFSDLNTGNEAQILQGSFSRSHTETSSSAGQIEPRYHVSRLLHNTDHQMPTRLMTVDVDSTVGHSVGNGTMQRQPLVPRPIRPHMSSVSGLSYTQGEVSASDDPPSTSHYLNNRGQGHRNNLQVYQRGSQNEDCMEAAVSSLSGSVSNEAEVHHQGMGHQQKPALLEIERGEPDTTQEDDAYDMDNQYGSDMDSDREPVQLSGHYSIVTCQPQSYTTLGLPASQSSQVTPSSLPVSFPASTISLSFVSNSTGPVYSHNHHLSSVSQQHQQLLAHDIHIQNLPANQMPVSLSSANQMVASLSSTNQISASFSSANQVQAASSSLSSTNRMPYSSYQVVQSMNSAVSQSVFDIEPSTVDSHMHAVAGPSHINGYTAQELSRISPDQATPSSSKTRRVGRRKSSRIAEIDDDPATYRKPHYQPTQYDPNEIWCDECMRTYEEECPTHKLVPLSDKIVFSRAWASLPSPLSIFRIDKKGGNETMLGVFAKRPIAKQMQFGPFVGDPVSSKEEVANQEFVLMVEQATGEAIFFDTSDENCCNWMIFVRPAADFSEQNLVAYQHGADIFFTTTKAIEPREELKVWYAAHYATRWNLPYHMPTEKDIQDIIERECKHQCYECPKRYRTLQALQKHMIVHEAGARSPDSLYEPSSSNQLHLDGTPGRRKSCIPTHIKQKIIQAKKAKEITTADAANVGTAASSSGVYHWKKTSANIYLNKTLKKYQKRHGAEIMRRNIQSQHQQQQQHQLQQFESQNPEDENCQESKEDNADDSDGMQQSIGGISCFYCNMVFDNSSLFSLHLLSHNPPDQATMTSGFSTSQMEQLGSLLGLGPTITSEGASVTNEASHLYLCPACPKQFFQKTELISHVKQHAKRRPASMKSDPDPKRPYQCEVCNKSFSTEDRLEMHAEIHQIDQAKPLQCMHCYKRFVNNSALSCHLKTHSSLKYYQCPICNLGFDHTTAMREHSYLHANPNGSFNCPECNKVFQEFLVLKRHMRGFHSNREFRCGECDRAFPRLDKLKLHSLTHTSEKEFMCESCGKQFKRRDKLKDHMHRMHSDERVEKDRMKAMKPITRKFIPKVAPTEFHRFIYKCHVCMLGFKRRGMLVNHIAKRHPEIKFDTVPELNLPILKTQRDYYCQYCDKVYKSSSKRKAHILKNHPGSELPQSGRKKSGLTEIPGIPNPTYSQTVGSITTMPHQCKFCHKQYASKAKLLQHMRKKHPGTCPDAQRNPIMLTKMEDGSMEHDHELMVEHYNGGTEQPQESAQATDLLTQAMSELTQSVEFRQITGGNPGDGTTYLATRLAEGTPTMVQIQTSGAGSITTDLAHLSQALNQFAPNQAHLPIQVQVSSSGGGAQIQIPILTSQTGLPGTTQIVTMETADADGNPQQNQVCFPSLNFVSGTYLPKNWVHYKTIGKN
ncbi:PR domain zinc finger protein 10-like [Dreissena polymorpha]|uniref:PR domain zinc finger protein 10-like n=1 Tax=Dreissena polymorpha TaxID=45954 RepID=UPI002264BFDB|nr:PR domain zinc finger protein 10-like [Dreissena polymorpha]XP_052253516.1 PR domain zinc finger protein 10-like [Dreissena polymorpha]XP_052253517.1 PR domain zinc finger protein 10-like [Dreissena polymorpha]XP_052253518.1 PR domain zinc finger protein 10-like [Dreissena polymorpha]